MYAIATVSMIASGNRNKALTFDELRLGHRRSNGNGREDESEEDGELHFDEEFNRDTWGKVYLEATVRDRA